MEYIIQTWLTEADRDNGFATESIRTTANIQDVMSAVIRLYNEMIKSNRGSIEIIDSKTYDAIYHISEDSNHELEKVES